MSRYANYFKEMMFVRTQNAKVINEGNKEANKETRKKPKITKKLTETGADSI